MDKIVTAKQRGQGNDPAPPPSKWKSLQELVKMNDPDDECPINFTSGNSMEFAIKKHFERKLKEWYPYDITNETEHDIARRGKWVQSFVDQKAWLLSRYRDANIATLNDELKAFTSRAKELQAQRSVEHKSSSNVLFHYEYSDDEEDHPPVTARKRRRSSPSPPAPARPLLKSGWGRLARESWRCIAVGDGDNVAVHKFDPRLYLDQEGGYERLLGDISTSYLTFDTVQHVLRTRSEPSMWVANQFSLDVAAVEAFGKATDTLIPTLNLVIEARPVRP